MIKAYETKKKTERQEVPTSIDLARCDGNWRKILALKIEPSLPARHG